MLPDSVGLQASSGRSPVSWLNLCHQIVKQKPLVVIWWITVELVNLHESMNIKKATGGSLSNMAGLCWFIISLPLIATNRGNVFPKARTLTQTLLPNEPLARLAFRTALQHPHA